MRKAEMVEGQGNMYNQLGRMASFGGQSSLCIECFKEKKLLCGAVPPTSTATPTSKKQRNLFGGTVPPTSPAGGSSGP